MKRRHCKICGSEFVTESLNKCYCSKVCAKMGKRLMDQRKHKQEVEANRGKKLLRESQSVSRSRTKKIDPNMTINNYLPIPIDSCFSCPFMGWECRTSEIPLYRKHSGNVHEFREVYYAAEVYA